MHSLAQRVATTNLLLAREIEAEFQRLENIIRGEADARRKSDDALRAKDKAVDELFRRIHTAGVDVSDLIS